jgi:hypothetical protein
MSSSTSSISKIQKWPPSNLQELMRSGQVIRRPISPFAKQRSFERVSLRSIIADFTQCNSCWEQVRDETAYVWKCRYCMDYILCQTCMDAPESKVQHTHFGESKGQACFRRFYWPPVASPHTLQLPNTIMANSFAYTFASIMYKFSDRLCMGQVVDVGAKTKLIEWITFQQFYQQVLQVVIHLHTLFSNNDNNNICDDVESSLCNCNAPRVMIWAPNSIAFATHYFACLLLHWVVVSVEPECSIHHVETCILQSSPQLLLTDTQGFEKFKSSSSITTIKVHDLSIELLNTSSPPIDATSLFSTSM